ncbi:MAG TPA: pyruvate kinase [Anaerolineaceae bacterium]
MNYTITATLGPASAVPPLWAAMRDAGATAFRLNTSHLAPDDLAGWLARLDAFRRESGADWSVVLDLQGSKWRLGQFPARLLAPGERLRLLHADSSPAQSVLPVPHADFFRAALASTGEVLLDDAKIALRVEFVDAESAVAVVVRGGEIRPRKGITLNGGEVRSEEINPRDRAVIEVSAEYSFVEYAISYVRDAQEMARYRALFPPAARLIAKLERESAMQAAEQIAAHAGSLWVCRGDLGMELGIPRMAAAVHQITAAVRSIPVPVVMAGQVFEHLVAHPEPTRSEVCFLYDCLQAGYAGVILSDECAVGQYPVEAVRAAALFR